MGTKCDRCDNEATVHEVSVRNGVKHERHLCEACAASDGFTLATGGNPNVVHLVKQLMTQGTGVPPTGPTPPPMGRLASCQTCRMTFADFKQQGMLGCPECYRCFEQFLGPLIERAQEGGVSHTGKVPSRLLSGAPACAAAVPHALGPAVVAVSDSSVAAREQVRQLKQQLEEAVKAEQYETAAGLRDQIRALSAQLEGESQQP